MPLTTCDDCRRSTSGCCPLHPRTVVPVMAALTVTLSTACMSGDHAWTPWLQLPNGSYVTVCGRQGCNAEKQYDL